MPGFRDAALWGQHDRNIIQAVNPHALDGHVDAFVTASASDPPLLSPLGGQDRDYACMMQNSLPLGFDDYELAPISPWPYSRELNTSTVHPFSFDVAAATEPLESPLDQR